MTYSEATPEVIEQIAAVIETAGWDAMARNFRNDPTLRTRIATAMIRNITRDNRAFGEQFARSIQYVRFS